MKRDDFNGIFRGGHGAGMAFVAPGEMNDVELRQVLPDDDWVSWDVAQHWPANQLAAIDYKRGQVRYVDTISYVAQRSDYYAERCRFFKLPPE